MRNIDADAFAIWVDDNVPSNTQAALIAKALVVAGLKSESITPTIKGCTKPQKDMDDDEFMTSIISQICDYAVEKGLEPDKTLETVANNIKALLELTTFNHWEPNQE